MDLAKYRALFVEEATENLAELSRALLQLEKDPAAQEAIDLAFRMAHSIKGMAASLEFESLAQLAHRLEDRMEAVRAAGWAGRDLELMFRGLEEIERLVAAVRDGGDPPVADPALLADLRVAPEPVGRPKKAPTRP